MTIMLAPCQAAVQFDGVNDHINIKSYLWFTGQTLSAWVKTTSTDAATVYSGNAAQTILGNHLSNIATGFGVHNGLARYCHYNGGWVCLDGTTLVNDGNWHHIIATHNGTTGDIEVFVDNVNEASGNETYHIWNEINRIGGGYSDGTGTGDLFTGSLDDVRIYNRALSVIEVQTLYNSRSKRLSGSLTNGLTAHFEMDDDAIGEITAQAKDSSGNLNHGQFIGFSNLVSNGYSTDVPVQIETRHSLEFDGVDDTIQTNLNLSGEDTVTTSFWFNKNNTSGTKMILELSTNFGSFNNGLAFAVDETSGPCAGYGIEMGVRGNADYNLACLSTAIPLNEWHHYVGIFDKSAISSNETKIFIDGIEQSVYRPPGFTNDNTNNFVNANFYIMSRANSSNFNSGFLDKIHIFNRALTPSEISFLYNGSGLNPGTSNLEALWTFDDDSGLKDSSGNNNHGVGVGGDSLKYTDGVLKR